MSAWRMPRNKDGLTFRLPEKIESLLATLDRLYERKREPLLREIVVNGRVSVEEAREYDNWNGGTYGHALTFCVPGDVFLEVADMKGSVESKLAQDLNALNSIDNENICHVFVEMVPSEPDHWREASGIYRAHAATPPISDAALRRIWEAFPVRVFLSHKASVKVETSAVKKALERCGVAAFVAHEDIEPTEEWQKEIERALFSMDALVALLTSDFHDSYWTDQEVGVAIGRGVPVIAIRLGRDPYGLMGKGQGVNGCSLSDPLAIASRVFLLLFKRLPDRSRLFECAVSAYSRSASLDESKWIVEHTLSHFESLASNQVDRVLMAFRTNRQNQLSIDARESLRLLLQRWTRTDWTRRGDDLVPVSPVSDAAEANAEIPF